MAFSKAHLYPENRRLVSNCGKIIAHPERLEIISLLRKHGICSVNELLKHSPLALTTLSQHLKILREHDVVSFEEIGPFIFYELNQIVVKKFFNAVEKFYLENLD